MAASDWADDAAREVGRWVDGARIKLQNQVDALTQPSLRLGVTGLARAGKTVLIASLAANLLRRGRLPGLKAEGEGRIVAAALTPQPDLDAPRFDVETHLEDLYGDPPVWPQSTRSVAQLRISLRYRSNHTVASLLGDQMLHLDIVDYPGEWLLDLPLMAQTYAEWSAAALALADQRPQAAGFLAWARGLDRSAPFDEATAQTGAALYAEYLKAARAAGLSGLAPGRFLLPGEMEGAPAVTFAPLPNPDARDPLAQELSRRYEGYKRLAVKPFFRDHFARLDRQIVLVDALSAVHSGPEATADLKAALTEILACFRPGENSWLRTLLGPAIGGRRIDKLLLAVSKADHIHHSAHPALNNLVRDLMMQTIDQAAFRGATVDAMALAGVRATTETEITANGDTLPAVAGRLASDGAPAKVFPGEPPASLAEIASGAWSPEDFTLTRFAPPKLQRRPGEGPPHLRLDRALEFLIGDKLA